MADFLLQCQAGAPRMGQKFNFLQAKLAKMAHSFPPIRVVRVPIGLECLIQVVLLSQADSNFDLQFQDQAVAFSQHLELHLQGCTTATQIQILSVLQTLESPQEVQMQPDIQDR